MKTLLLVRHAKAAPAAIGQSDHGRALEDSGVTDAGKLAHYLRSKSILPDQMLVSSANRTQSTAQILLTAFDGVAVDVLVSDELYLAPDAFLAEVVARTDDAVHTLMLVGHNPGLSDLVSHYQNQPVGLGTAQMFMLQFDTDHWALVETAAVKKARLVSNHPT